MGNPFNLTPDQLAGTCIADEAGNQPYEGMVAVGCVIVNRMLSRYASDGTVLGTVLHKWAFSGFWAQMVADHYSQISFDLAQAEAEAMKLYATFSGLLVWNQVERAWNDALAWKAGRKLSFTPGPQFEKLNAKTVLYLNPAITPVKPAWFKPEAIQAVIFQHTFCQDLGA